MIEIAVDTPRRRALVDVTGEVAGAIRASGEGDGVWLVAVPHTTAGVTVNEAADPDVARDLLLALERLAPEDLPYRHAEGNSPAHVLTTLVGSSTLVVVRDGRPALGRWQGIFLCEFDGPRTRRVRLSRIGG